MEPPAAQSTPGQDAAPVAPNTNGATDPTLKPMGCDAPRNQPTTSSVPAKPAAVAGSVESPKPSPAKSRSRTRNKKPNQPRPEQEALDTKVEVSGYPSYAKPQDLHKIFSAYGAPRVEHMGRRFAVIGFESKEVARAAMNDSMQLCLYSQFLTIRPFSGVVDDQKKQVFKSKHTVTVVEPEQIRLAGSFGEQLGALLAAVRLTQHEVTALSALYGDLERVLQPVWPGCQAMPFGSITTGLGVKSSDADCFINIPPQYRYGYHNFVIKARRILQQYPELFSEVFAIPRANTPIVKLFHLPTRTHCDLTFKTPLGALNSKLVAFLLHADPRFLPLAVVVKYWASVHGVSGSGKLTNYALTLMLVFYLQSRGCLPAVAWLQRDAAPLVVDGWNAGFVEDYRRLPPSTDAATIEDLLGGFFKFYDAFDFEHLVACPYLGRAVEKAHFADNNLPEEFQRYRRNVADNLVAPLRTKVPVCVQDPFEHCHNVASSVTPRMAEDIRVYVRFAAEFYERDRATGCEGLLRTILLEKPKMVRTRSNPEYRVNLYPKALKIIVHDDWQAAVRKTVFTIFECMLKLKLRPAGEPEPTRNGREKEKYVTSLNKPLWNRKPYTRRVDALRLGFIERHARITEEIISNERSEGALEFQVILSFCTKLRNACLTVRLTNGDMDAFYFFGRYFLTTMHNWIITVLHLTGHTASDAAGKTGGVNSNAANTDYDSDSPAENDAPMVRGDPQAALKEALHISSEDETRTSPSKEAPQGSSKEVLEDAPEDVSENTPEEGIVETPEKLPEKELSGNKEEITQCLSSNC